MWQSQKLKFGLYSKFIGSKELKGISNILLTIDIMHFEATLSKIPNLTWSSAYVSFFVWIHDVLALNKLTVVSYLICFVQLDEHLF